MLRSKTFMIIAILAVASFVTSQTQAQQTLVNPNPEGPGTGIGQPAQTFYDHQLGVTFTRIAVGVGAIGGGGGGESRPSVRVNPGVGGGGGGFEKGLRVDGVDCNGLGKRIGLELGDVITRCDVQTNYETRVYPGGAASSHLQVIDIRTGRTVTVTAPGVRLYLDINGINSRPVVDPGFNPGETNPGSRPIYRTYGG